MQGGRANDVPHLDTWSILLVQVVLVVLEPAALPEITGMFGERAQALNVTLIELLLLAQHVYQLLLLVVQHGVARN